jgi:methylated-DNA-[protein]-cysteine S-methyltransferase
MTRQPVGLFLCQMETEIGGLRIFGDAMEITAVEFADGQAAPAETAAVPDVLLECRQQIEEYFAGRRRHFSLPLSTAGTAFQRQVWRQLQAIPFGQIRSYGWLAREIGRPRSARAVGAANHANPLAIVVPCHRVVGADGQLVGYGGGLWRKEWLLAHEKRVLDNG